VPESAAAIVARKKHLLMDFDGPICAVFGSVSAPRVADALVRLLARRGVSAPPEVATAKDPFDVLHFGATLPDVDHARAVEAEMRRLEVLAVATAPPAPESTATLRILSDYGLLVSIVSNNSDAAVRAYLTRHGLDDIVTDVSSRSDADTSHLKPAPFLLVQAMHNLGTRPDECVMVGDSPSDMQAAHRAGVAAIAYANKPGKAEILSRHSPEALIDRVGDLRG
jgi:beta-phosphoglucomutase-like phosphatase (HAD superfamily)